MFTRKLGQYETAVSNSITRLQENKIIERIHARDYTVWRPTPNEISNRLGWLDAPAKMAGEVARLNAFAAGVTADGFTDVLLLGMGGSSLAPEMFARIFGADGDGLRLEILDTTDPDAVLAHARRLDVTKTLFIVATKSGGTAETLSGFAYFYNLVAATVSEKLAGSHFVAITDPGSKLVTMAEKYNFREVFLNDPNVGGRYSVLTFFGLVPAALIGLDVGRLVENAIAAGDAAALELGCVLGTLAQAGRDKLTFVLPNAIAPFADWAEQLVAESTGKEGKGILPVVGESVGDGAVYGDDRLFVQFALAGDAVALPADQPSIRIELADLYDLGGQFMVWEMATAVSAHIIDVQPFDQPNVESAKIRAREMVAAYRAEGSLPAPAPSLTADGVRVWAAFSASSPAAALRHFLAETRPGDYVSIQAYLPPDGATDDALAKLRVAARKHSGLAVTVGYGPRFLHSTGQLHKGDAGNGLFLQLTCDHPDRVPIPDGAETDAASLDFATLIAAQALGDRQALLDGGRRVLRLHVGSDPLAHLASVTRALKS